jgi:hypothetical protein
LRPAFAAPDAAEAGVAAHAIDARPTAAARINGVLVCVFILPSLEPTGSDLIATVGFPCHSGATLSIRRLPSFVMAYFCCGEFGDAPHKVDKPRALVPVKEVRAVGDATDQVIAPIWKIYPAMSHAEQYIINSRYCGNLLWQSGLTLSRSR